MFLRFRRKSTRKPFIFLESKTAEAQPAYTVVVYVDDNNASDPGSAPGTDIPMNINTPPEYQVCP